MKKLILFIILFPIVIGAQERTKFIKYERDNHFIEYPSNWILNDLGDNGTKFFLYPKNSISSNVFTENINLIVKNVDNTISTIEDYKVLVEQQISSMLTESKISLSEIVNKNSLKSHHLIAEGKSGDYKFKTVIYSYLMNEQIYTLTFVTLHETYEDNHIQSLRIMDSFSLIKS